MNETTRAATPDIVFLVGMHRSGTSALTRVLSLCGGALPLELLPPDFGNPSGYWEPPGAIELNDAFLNANGSSWYDTSLALQTAPVGAAERAGFIAKIVDFLSSGFGNAGPVLLKEPRVTLFLPYWKAAAARLGLQVKIVHLFRNPFDVAASLAVRNQLAADHSLALWLKYNLAGERDARDCRRIFVAYEDVMSDWRSVVARCIAELDLELAVSAEAAEAVARHLVPELQHHRGAAAGSSPAIDGQLLRWIQEAYAALARGAGGSNPSAELDAIFAEFAASAHAAPRYSDERGADRTARRDDVARDRWLDVGVGEAGRDPHTAEINRLTYRLAKERYTRELRERAAGEEAGVLRDELTALRGEVTTLRAELTNAAAALQAALALQAQRESEHAQQRDALEREHAQQRDGLEREHAQLRDGLEREHAEVRGVLERENAELRSRLATANVREAELMKGVRALDDKANAALEQVYEQLRRNREVSAQLDVARAAAERNAEDRERLAHALAQLERDAAELDRTADRLRAELAEREALLAAMESSRSWRLTAPLRRAKRALSAPAAREQPARPVP
jgi:hypothetical protein